MNTMISPTYPLQPATLDLASYIGCALARDTLSSEKRTLYHRIWARMSPDAYKRVSDAYAAAVQS